MEEKDGTWDSEQRGEGLKFSEETEEDEDLDEKYMPGLTGPTMTERFLRWLGVQISAKKWHRFQQISTYIGVFFVFVPSGVPWYWGNVVVYTDSYFRSKDGPGGDNASTWTLSLYLIVWTSGIPISEKLRRVFGPALLQVLASSCFAAAIFLSYFAVQYSQLALVLTVGVICGLSGGCLYGQSLWMITEWTERKNTGFVTSILTMGYTGGAIAINQFVTRFVNPDNLVTDLESGPRKYFTQTSLLESVPSLFIAVGCYSVFFHTLSFLCIWRRTTSASVLKDSPTDVTYSVNCEARPILKSDENSYVLENVENGRIMITNENGEVSSVKNQVDFENMMNEKINGEVPTHAVNGHFKGDTIVYRKEEAYDHELVHLLNENEEETLSDTEDARKTIKKKNHESVGKTKPAYYGRDLSPSEMLRTSTFYVIWTGLLCSDCCYTIMVNFYKAFGQLSIHDDHFLANMTFFFSMAVMVTKPLWGLIVDRIGVKFTLVAILAIQSLDLANWYFTPILGRWVYLIFTMLFALAAGGVYLQAFICALNVFGKTHILTNFGVLVSSGILANLMAPTVFEFIAHNYGWFILFITVGIVNTLGLVFVVFKHPEI